MDIVIFYNQVHPIYYLYTTFLLDILLHLNSGIIYQIPIYFVTTYITAEYWFLHVCNIEISTINIQNYMYKNIWLNNFAVSLYRLKINCTGHSNNIMMLGYNGLSLPTFLVDILATCHLFFIYRYMTSQHVAIFMKVHKNSSFSDGWFLLLG